MKTDTTKAAAEAAEGALFLGDDWFDLLEAEPACEASFLAQRIIQVAWDVPTEATYFGTPSCARRSPARAAVRAARRQDGNNGLVPRTPWLTHSGANFQDHDTRYSVRHSSLLRYARVGSS
jgi:hypothetical protein